MSLKAKLEAVIYAAEEPVTLAQLAVLFAADALEWKAQQEADAAGLSSHQPFLGDDFAVLDPDSDLNLETDPAFGAEAVLESDTSAESEAAPEATLEATPEAAPEAAPENLPAPTEDAESATPNPALVEAEENVAPSLAEAESAPPAVSPEEAELEQKRQARQLDREVRAILRQLLDELIAAYASDSRGVEIREIAGGFRMATKPECHDAVRLFIKSLKPALKLSLPALETLAIIAYKQPITAPEVNEIRGVESSGVFGSLLARKLIATAGRKQVIGRPILYKTTKEFLLRFGLKDVAELPSMEEFEKLAAIELDEPETAEEAEQRANPTAGPEFNEAASEELEDAPSGLGTEGLIKTLPTQPDSHVTPGTAETAGRNETTPAEAAPAAPLVTEQAEIESSSHDHPQESNEEGRQEINCD